MQLAGAHVLVTGASRGIGGLLEVDAASMAHLFEVNLLAPAELVRQTPPGMMVRGRGHLVDVSSGFAAVNAPGLMPYAVSRAGLSHVHAGVRGELRGTGVGTTLVEPGPVRTGMWDGIVVLPWRMALVMALVMALGWLPRRVSEIALLGVPKR